MSDEELERQQKFMSEFFKDDQVSPEEAEFNRYIDHQKKFLRYKKKLLQKICKSNIYQRHIQWELWHSLQLFTANLTDKSVT